MSSLIATFFLLSSLDPASSAAAQAPPHWLDCSTLETPQGREIVDRIAYVFFDADSSIITALGATMLDGFVSGYDAAPHCQVIVDGNTDRAGSARHNLRLSRRRARAVAAYLRRKGLVAPIVIEGAGETRPLVETADGVAEPQNRYVVVSVTDPPASPH